MALSTPPSPLGFASRNPYNNASAEHSGLDGVVTEPAPTFIGHNNSRSSGAEPSSITATGSAHNHRQDRRLGVVARMEEGLLEFTEKVEEELGVGPRGRTRRQEMWARFRGEGRRKVGWIESLLNVMKSSFLNLFLLFIPFAWASSKHWKNDNLTFALAFLSIMPLEKLFDYGGEQMALYTGKDLGDLIIVTLNNAVEATLAIILLVNCQLRILQATIVGVVLLHLLLVPGTGFLTGGAHIYEQSLHPHYTELNHTLLAIGVLSLLVPAAFFSALGLSTSTQSTLLDSRPQFLHMSRGLAVLLLLVYLASRIFLHNPPGKGNAFTSPNAPPELRHREEHLRQEDPEVNPWFCIVFLVVTIAIMAITAEMLVESIEHVREQGQIGEEWFGLILLPLVSFSADGAVAVIYFARTSLFLKPEPPKTLAEDRAIDLSIQFTLFWMPFLVLIAWWTGRPLMLLFDLYEVAILLGACFLVNYVTADSKTNWAEGYIMITFYMMIALCTWFYGGQEAIQTMLASCKGDLGGDPLGEVAAAAEEVVGEVVEEVKRRMVMLI
ncbi:hypothetical protein M0805_002957 [Coniferiporia weirii]|nr:hypothetical protein M0805_002957 [Coniferiporia weirii]